MSIGAVSLSSVAAQNSVRGSINQWKQGLTNLSDSLQAGDLKGAQNAFKDLVTLHQSNESSRPPGSGNLSLQSDFKALGSALSAGDLSASESAFDQLRTDLQAARAQQSSRPAPAARASRTADADGDNDGTTGAVKASTSYTSSGSAGSTGASTGTILGMYA
ncbi:MAG: hypothetical protein ABI693_11890 [Bryobacteraceae bacterium]